MKEKTFSGISSQELLSKNGIQNEIIEKKKIKKKKITF